MRNLFIISFLLVAVVAIAGTQRIITVDLFQSSDLTKTWTPPSGTDTLTGNSSVQTLTNKSISGATNTITSIAPSSITGGALVATNNLSDVANSLTSRNNIGVDTAGTKPIAFFLQSANNLSDVASSIAAYHNLGGDSAGTHVSGFFNQVANNLSDVANSLTAYHNLGGDVSGTHINAFFLQSANNLSDLASSSAARNSLGLGNGALSNLSNLSDIGTDGITVTGGINTVLGIGGTSLSQHVADATHNGYLSSSDFNTFTAGAGGGTLVQFGTFGSSPNTKGATTSGSTITLQPTDGTFPGGLSTGAQTIGGQKTFSTGLTGTLTGSATLNLLASSNLSDVANSLTARNNLGVDTAGTKTTAFFLQAANNLSDLASSATARNNLGLGNGSTSTLSNLTDAGTDGITITGGINTVLGIGGTSLSQHIADATHNGYLSSTDWSTFNGKGSGTVTNLTIASANGLAGAVATSTTTPVVTLSTTITGVLKGNGTAISAATAGTDYAAATTGTSLLRANGSGGFSNAVPNVDYQVPIPSFAAVSNQFLTAFTSPSTFSSAQPAFTNISGVLAATQLPALSGDVSSSQGSSVLTLATVNGNVGSFTNASITVNAKGLITAAASGSGSSGTVTGLSIISANGFAGTVANSTTIPEITLKTTITGIIKGNGTAISAATSGTDYAPATTGTSVLSGNGSGGFTNNQQSGSGSVVLNNSPVFVTPNIDNAVATSVNNLNLVRPATGAKLTITDGKAISLTNSLTFSGTDGSTLNIGGGGTLGTAAFQNLSAFLQPSNNLSDLGSSTTAKNNLGLGNAAMSVLSSLTDAGTDGITITGGINTVLGVGGTSLSQHVADATHNGYLSSSDFTSFNTGSSGTNLKAANNLTDLANSITAKSNLAITSGSLFITTGTTYVTPPLTNTATRYKFTMLGGGGGGGGSSLGGTAGYPGGSSGGCILFTTGLGGAATFTIAIGAAGAAGSTSGGNGGNGGNTTLAIGGTTYTAGGGGGGGGDIGGGGLGSGGTATNCTINTTGQIATTTVGGNTPYGFGFGGANATNGTVGTGPGSGGGGANGAAANSGGAGVKGAILVEWAN